MANRGGSLGDFGVIDRSKCFRVSRQCGAHARVGCRIASAPRRSGIGRARARARAPRCAWQAVAARPGDEFDRFRLAVSDVAEAPRLATSTGIATSFEWQNLLQNLKWLTYLVRKLILTKKSLTPRYFGCATSWCRRRFKVIHLLDILPDPFVDISGWGNFDLLIRISNPLRNSAAREFLFVPDAYVYAVFGTVACALLPQLVSPLGQGNALKASWAVVRGCCAPADAAAPLNKQITIRPG